MRGKVSITLAVAALALGITQPASASHAKHVRICGPDLSLLLWPKGYATHPLPSLEIYRGLKGPYSAANHLGTETATNAATGASVLDQGCANYPGTAPLSHTLIDSRTKGETRLSCAFPGPPAVFTDPRRDHSIRVRLVLPSGALVAEALVSAHGSTLAYAARYCTARHSLSTPAS